MPALRQTPWKPKKRKDRMNKFTKTFSRFLIVLLSVLIFAVNGPAVYAFDIPTPPPAPTAPSAPTPPSAPTAPPAPSADEDWLNRSGAGTRAIGSSLGGPPELVPVEIISHSLIRRKFPRPDALGLYLRREWNMELAHSELLSLWKLYQTLNQLPPALERALAREKRKAPDAIAWRLLRQAA